MKTCTKCKLTKEDGEFHKRKKILQALCKVCKSIDQKQRWARDKAAFNNKKWESNKKRKQTLQRFILGYLQSHPCVVCNEKDPIVLEFDHRGNKSFNVSEAVRRVYNIERVKNEIAKCDVLCANCHKRKTAKDFNWFKAVYSSEEERLSHKQKVDSSILSRPTKI